MNRRVALIAFLSSTVGLTGCAGIIMEQSRKHFAGQAEVEEDFPELQTCDKPQEATWSCRGASGEGDVFIILNKTEGNSIENSQRLRKLEDSFTASLAPGLSAKSRPLMGSPLMGDKQMDQTSIFGGIKASFTGTMSQKFTGTWLVVSR